MTSIRQWELWRLPRALQAILLLQVAVAAGVAISALVRAEPPAGEAWLLFGLLAVAGHASDRLASRMGEAFAMAGNRKAGGMSVHTRAVWLFAGIVALPVVLVVALALISGLTEETRIRRNRPADNPYLLHRLVFNVGLTVTQGWTGAIVYGAFVMTGSTGQEFLAALTAWAAMYVMSQSVLGSILMLATGRPYRFPFSVFRTASWEWMGMAAQGCLLALAWRIDPVMILMGVPPILLLQQALLHNQLRESAARDAKTGLFGATKWRECGEAALAKARDRNAVAAVLLVDLDHFKSVNDTYGHLVGDEVLQAVADAMQATVRDADVVGRFGGEEFVILLPETGAADALAVAERVRRAIAEAEIALEGQARPLHVTTSIGVSVFPADGDHLDALLEQADRALYAAKHAGRNQVMLAAVAGAPDTVPATVEVEPKVSSSLPGV